MSLHDEIATDLDAFFDTASGFAKAITIDGDPIVVIDEYEFVLAEAGEAELEDQETSLQAKTSDVTGYALGVAVVLEGVNYTLRGNEPDGTGVSMLRLERVD